MAPRAFLAVAALLLAGCTSPAPAQEVPHVEAPRPAQIVPYQVQVRGETAAGLMGVPETHAPTTLVVLAHSWGGGAEDFRTDLLRFAETGVLAVAMEFRGNVGDFKVAAGAEDTVAAALDLQARHPSVTQTLVFGYSMGGEVALMAAAEAPSGTFDYVFAGAGVYDLQALWNENVFFRPALEAETGGTPDQVRDEYMRRSPWARVLDLERQGLSRVFLVHAAADGSVALEHAERLYQALADAGVPVSYYVVTRNDEPWVCIPVVAMCSAGVPGGPASHEAGQLELMLPFIEHRIERARDPSEAAVRGTYDGEAGTYEPSDVGP